MRHHDAEWMVNVAGAQVPVLVRTLASLADRSTYCVIRRHDPCVRTENCLALYPALHASAPEQSRHVLCLEPGDGHAISDGAHDAGAAWLLGRLA